MKVRLTIIAQIFQLLMHNSFGTNHGVDPRTKQCQDCCGDEGYISNAGGVHGYSSSNIYFSKKT